jgi:hypothetical protein
MQMAQDGEDDLGKLQKIANKIKTEISKIKGGGLGRTGVLGIESAEDSSYIKISPDGRAKRLLQRLMELEMACNKVIREASNEEELKRRVEKREKWMEDMGMSSRDNPLAEAKKELKKKVAWTISRVTKFVSNVYYGGYGDASGTRTMNYEVVEDEQSYGVWLADLGENPWLEGGGGEHAYMDLGSVKCPSQYGLLVEWMLEEAGATLEGLGDAVRGKVLENIARFPPVKNWNPWRKWELVDKCCDGVDGKRVKVGRGEGGADVVCGALR